jgi:hypothetical protein
MSFLLTNLVLRCKVLTNETTPFIGVVFVWYQTFISSQGEDYAHS